MSILDPKPPSYEDGDSPGVFFKATVTLVSVLLSGTSFAAAWAVWNYTEGRSPKVVGTILFIVLAIAIIWFACFVVWASERGKSREVQRKLDSAVEKISEIKSENAQLQAENTELRNQAANALALKDKRPRLLGRINSFRFVEPSLDPNYVNGLVFYLNLMFVNESAVATDVHNVRFVVNTDKREYIATTYDKPLAVYDYEKDQLGEMLPLHSFLANKEMAVQGKRVRGELEFAVPDITMDEHPDFKCLTLLLEDSFGEWHKIIWELPKIYIPNSPH